MRRTALFVVAWFTAGVAAVSLAVAAISMVGNQVTGSRPAPLSAAEVEAELTEGTPTTTSTAAPGPSATATTQAGTASTPSTTIPGAGTPTTAAPSPTTAAPAAPAETRSYSMVGGSATLRFAATGVTVVVANPNAGFSVDIETTHDNGVRVEFRSDEHRSRVEGWWDGGPRDEVEEHD